MRRFFGKLYVQVLIGVFAGAALGFFVPNIGSDFKPLGDIFTQLDTKAIAGYTAASAKPEGLIDFLMHLVPTSVVDALARNDILQILVFATMFGVALSHIGPRAKPVVDFLDSFTHGVFSVVGMIMRLAPLAAFGAMAFTVGNVKPIRVDVGGARIAA